MRENIVYRHVYFCFYQWCEGRLAAIAFGPAARKAWMSLLTYINKDDDMTEVCEGTNKKNDRPYCLDRKRNVGDRH